MHAVIRRVYVHTHLQFTPLLKACVSGCVEAVRTLLEHGADMTVTDSNNYNCLDRAIQQSHLGVVTEIVSHGR